MTTSWNGGERHEEVTYVYADYIFNCSLQACAQELDLKTDDQSEKSNDISQKNQFFVEEKNKETLLAPVEKDKDAVILNGCMPDMSVEDIQAQFGPEVKVGSLDFCHREKKEDLDKYKGQLYVFGYGRKKGEAGDCMLGYSELSCERLSFGIQHELSRTLHRLGPYHYRIIREFNIFYNLKFLNNNLKSEQFHAVPRVSPRVGGHYLKNSVNEVKKVACLIWTGHSTAEKKRLLGECYQRWVERKSPKRWIDHQDKLWKFDLKKN